MFRLVSILLIIEYCLILPIPNVAFHLSVMIGPSNRYKKLSEWTKRKALSYSQSTDVDARYQKSFADRMRKIALIEQSKRSSAHDDSDATTIRKKPNHIIDVTSISKFRDVVLENGMKQHKISAVRWYAPWCRSCRAVEPIFYGLHDKLGHRNHQVQYIDVAATKDGKLHASFGVPKVPYGHIYYPGVGLVEELRFTPKRANDFEQILRSYADGYCDLSQSIYEEKGIYDCPYQRSS